MSGVLTAVAGIVAAGWAAPVLVALAAVIAVWLAAWLTLVVLGRRGPARALARFIPDLLVLFKRLFGDPRVPRGAKVRLGLGLAYLASPLDLVPDLIPVLGQLDDAAVCALVLRSVLRAAGAEVVRELWPGPPDSLDLLLRLAAARPARHRRAIVALVAVVLPLAVLVALALAVRANGHMVWDVRVLEWIERRRGGGLSDIIETLTDLGAIWMVAPAAAVAVVLFWRHGRSRAALYVAVTLATSVAFSAWLKVVIHRHPPNVVSAVVPPSHYSFPSGHTMNSTTLAATLVIALWPTRFRRPVLIAGVLYAVGIGLSRLYLGVHYPSDVLAGWALSLTLACGAALVLEPAADAKASTPVRLLLLDWGDTLMVDDPAAAGPMAEWPHVEAVAGAQLALGELRAGDRLLIVATNADMSDAAAVRAALARVQLDVLVDDVVSSRDVGVRKPDPAFFRAALARAAALGYVVAPAEAVMVGDSFDNDVAGAKAAGLRAVWLDREGQGAGQAGLSAAPHRAARLRSAPRGSAPRLVIAEARPIAQPVVPDAVIASMADLPAAIRHLEEQPRRRRGYRRPPPAPWTEPPGIG